MLREISFTIPGRPVGKERPRVTKSGHAFTPEKTRKAEQAIALLARVATSRVAAMHRPLAPYKVEIGIVWEDKRHPDIDNVAKCVLDAMNGVAYPDDADVSMLVVRAIGTSKQYPRVTVVVSESLRD